MASETHIPRQTWLPICIWLARLAVGATFIFAGVVKAVDLWGFVYKIEEYLAVWDWWQPRAIILAVALLVSGFEFITGVLLLTGCYRRGVPLLMLLMMAFMLPLTGYIWISNPVADCGCFGDAFVISNGFTFVKNIFLTALLIFLVGWNKKASGLYGPYIQWLTFTVSLVYILIIGIFGYNIQPMLDFRSFPEGTPLLSDSDNQSSEPVLFIYEKDGVEKTFDSYNLPDSTWRYLDRLTSTPQANSKTEFFVLEDGYNIAEEIIDTRGIQLLFITPEYRRSQISYSYLLNEMNSYVDNMGGSAVALMGASQDEIEEWIDLSMAEYPVYQADPTMLKEMARGNISVILLEGGKIKWKRTASSIDAEMFERNSDENLLDGLYFDGREDLLYLTLFYVGVLFIIFLLDRSGRLLKWKSALKKLERNRNQETDTSESSSDDK